MELVVLGSGTARPTAERGSPGYLLGFADGRGVLLDPGPGSVRAAARVGHPPESLRGVLLTHFHPDHNLDLFALLFALRSPMLEGCRLTVAGPTGLAGLLERMGRVYGDWVRLAPERLRIVELEPGPLQVELDDLRLDGAALRMPHLAHSLGYRLRGRSRELAYSGDTGAGPEVVELGRAVDLYVLEAALPDGSDTARHLTPETAAQLAAQAGCRELVLTHFYPETEADDPASSARRHFTGPLQLAHDQLRLAL